MPTVLRACHAKGRPPGIRMSPLLAPKRLDVLGFHWEHGSVIIMRLWWAQGYLDWQTKWRWDWTSPLPSYPWEDELMLCTLGAHHQDLNFNQEAHNQEAESKQPLINNVSGKNWDLILKTSYLGYRSGGQSRSPRLSNIIPIAFFFCANVASLVLSCTMFKSQRGTMSHLADLDLHQGYRKKKEQVIEMAE